MGAEKRTKKQLTRHFAVSQIRHSLQTALDSGGPSRGTMKPCAARDSVPGSQKDWSLLTHPTPW
jgi:hypothetical protein